MLVAKEFYDKKTGEVLHYTTEEREDQILLDWSERKKDPDLERYKKYLKGFGVTEHDFLNKVVADIGCGPWGGILNHAKLAKRRIGIDPLIEQYIKKGIFDYKDEYLIDDAQRIRLKGDTVDMVFCLNALDHCDHTGTPLKIVKEIYRILKPGGKAYIYVHLRDGGELNIMHLYGIEEKDCRRYFEKFKTIKFEVLKTDTVWGTKHLTFWGIFEK